MTAFESLDHQDELDPVISVEKRRFMGSRVLFGVPQVEISHSETTNLTDIVYDLDTLYRHSWVREWQPHFSTRNELNAKRWELSGLEAQEYVDEIIGIADLSVSSLIRSVSSGAIRTAVKDELQAELMQKVTVQISGQQVQLGKYNLDEYHAITDVYHEKLAFVNRMVAEAKDNTYQGKYRAGPHKDHFRTITLTAQQGLIRVHPELTMEALHEESYQSPETRQLINDTTIDRKDAELLRDIRYNWSKGLRDMAEAHITLAKNHTLARGALDTPSLVRQSQQQGCANAAFRMIFEGVSGDMLNEMDLELAMLNTHQNRLVHDEEYLKLLETNEFKDKYGIRVQSMQFMGMTLDSIEDIATRLKAKRPDAKVFVALALHTDSNENLNIQHRAVLLGADEQRVTILDPKYRKERNLSKNEFSYRWARAQNSGYLVIAA